MLDKLEGANVSELASRVDVLSKSVGTAEDTRKNAATNKENVVVSEAMKDRLQKLIAYVNKHSHRVN